MAALRLARAATGRTIIIKAAGCYHGHGDSLLVKAGSGVATLGLPDSPGVTAAVAENTITAPFNDADALERVFDEHGADVAAVIVEPVVGNMGCVPPRAGYLQALRDVTRRHGALLILDEVMTGFRLARGGAQEVLGITPDLTTLGKIVGGGLPMGIYGGRREIMERVAPLGPVYQAGTLSGNPLAVAAGRATLERLDETAYMQLSSTTQALAEALRDAAGDRPVSVVWTTGLLTVFFSPEPPTDYASAAACDTDAYGAWCRALLARGVYPPPSQFEAWFPSLAHTPELIARTAEAAAAAFAEVSP